MDPRTFGIASADSRAHNEAIDRLAQAHATRERIEWIIIKSLILFEMLFGYLGWLHGAPSLLGEAGLEAEYAIAFALAGYLPTAAILVWAAPRIAHRFAPTWIVVDAKPILKVYGAIPQRDVGRVARLLLRKAPNSTIIHDARKQLGCTLAAIPQTHEWQVFKSRMASEPSDLADIPSAGIHKTKAL